MYPPNLIIRTLCFLIHFSLSTKNDNTRNGIENPNIQLIIIIIPISGLVAASDNTIARIGPVHGVHPNANAKKRTKKSSWAIFREVLSFSVLSPFPHNYL